MANHSEKHTEMIIRSEQPLNAEAPLDLLPRNFITPTELFYIRNHGSMPEVDTERYRLSVTGMVQQQMRLSLNEIRQNFSKSTVTATLQCAGNRRQDLMEVAPIPGEEPWSAGAIGNAEWSGALLTEVLQAAGVYPEVRHVAFTGLDEIEMGDQSFGFGGSIPIEKAMSTEVLLAYEMNGELLTPGHGFPLRVVAPGYIGARSVKWLANIRVQEEPSSNYYQTHAYKLFPPQVDEETADWSKGLMLGELSVNSVICQPADEETLPAGPISVRGYAITGGERSVERVRRIRGRREDLDDSRSARRERALGLAHDGAHDPGSPALPDAALLLPAQRSPGGSDPRGGLRAARLRGSPSHLPDKGVRRA